MTARMESRNEAGAEEVGEDDEGDRSQLDVLVRWTTSARRARIRSRLRRLRHVGAAAKV